MDPELIDRLQLDLTAAGYRPNGVAAALGAVADDARQRGVFAPARRVLAERGQSSLATLIRVFLLGDPVDAEELDAALPQLCAAGARQLGLVTTSDLGLVAALSLNPVAVADSIADAPQEWWIISDLDDQLRRGPARADHVMGVGGATRSLIAQMPTAAVDQSLDLGTGCGIVALHLALRGTVVATDISERALELARANARLNGLDAQIEFCQGDLFAPVSGQMFDLVLSNPPFVITPRGDTGESRYAYRDGGMTGDDLAAAVVSQGPTYLSPGGELLCLANWECPWGEDGLERVRAWIEASGVPLGAWVLERDRVAPAQYAETWARDGGARPGEPEFERLVDAWLDDFAARSIAAIGLGSIRLRRRAGEDAGDVSHTAPAALAERDDDTVHLERAGGSYATEHLGNDLTRAFDAGLRTAQMNDTEVLSRRWIGAEHVVEERLHTPGAESPNAITLCVDRPVARRITADTLLAAAFGACDGDLTLAQIADALATLLEVDADATSEALVASVRELAWLGMISPA